MECLPELVVAGVAFLDVDYGVSHLEPVRVNSIRAKIESSGNRIQPEAFAVDRDARYDGDLDLPDLVGRYQVGHRIGLAADPCSHVNDGLPCTSNAIRCLSKYRVGIARSVLEPTTGRIATRRAVLRTVSSVRRHDEVLAVPAVERHGKEWRDGGIACTVLDRQFVTIACNRVDRHCVNISVAIACIIVDMMVITAVKVAERRCEQAMTGRAVRTRCQILMERQIVVFLPQESERWWAMSLVVGFWHRTDHYRREFRCPEHRNSSARRRCLRSGDSSCRSQAGSCCYPTLP